ncbi:hypothetical protein D3C77_667940 [compost metagenome]
MGISDMNQGWILNDQIDDDVCRWIVIRMNLQRIRSWTEINGKLNPTKFTISNFDQLVGGLWPFTIRNAGHTAKTHAMH